MLGSIDTGGFSEAGKAAMMDSDYFKPKSKNPFMRGFDFLQNHIKKLNKPLDEDRDTSFLQSFLPKSYRPEEKSSQEQITDLLAAKLGLGGSGVQDVGGGLRLAGQNTGFNQPIIIPGREGSGGFMGALKGGLGGFIQGGVPGALAGGALGLIS